MADVRGGAPGGWDVLEARWKKGFEEGVNSDGCFREKKPYEN